MPNLASAEASRHGYPISEHGELFPRLQRARKQAWSSVARAEGYTRDYENSYLAQRLSLDGLLRAVEALDRTRPR